MAKVSERARSAPHRLHFGPDISCLAAADGRARSQARFDWDHDFEALVQARAPLAVVCADDPPALAGGVEAPARCVGIWVWGVILGALFAVALVLDLPEWLGIGRKSQAPVPWTAADSVVPILQATPVPQTLHVYDDAAATRAAAHMRRASTADLLALVAVMQAEAARPGHPLAAYFQDKAQLARAELARRGMGADLAQ